MVKPERRNQIEKSTGNGPIRIRNKGKKGRGVRTFFHGSSSQ